MPKIELPREKKVGHLTLHRQPRTITPREFNALSRAERLEVLRTVSGRRKYDLLIEAADGQELLQQLPPQEIYLLARELGSEDVPELVLMASPEQLTALIDLDCWQEDRLDRSKALHWLSLLLEADDGQILATLRALDVELLTGILQPWVVVVRGPEDIEEEDARIEAVNRDGGYEIEFTDSEAAKPVGRLLKLLQGIDAEFYRQLVEGVRQELPSQLEEELYRWRSGRLEDFGFVAPDEAKSVYAWLDPAAFRTGEHEREATLAPPHDLQPPGYLLSEVAPQPLLAEVFTSGVGADAAWELTFLLNKLMAADQVDPGDGEQVKTTLRRLYATLNLALEELAGDDVAQAAELFETVYSEQLFRLGWSLAVRLQQRAGRLLRSAIGPYLDPPLRPAVEALAAPVPGFYLPLEGDRRAVSRPFSRRRELELAGQLLERLERQERLFTRHLPELLEAAADLDLAGCEPAGRDDLALSDLFLTALANRLLGRDFRPLPIPAAELHRLQQVVSLGGALDPELRERTRNWLEGFEAGAGSFADWCLEIWEEEFCPLPADDLNPRYLPGLIVCLD